MFVSYHWLKKFTPLKAKPKEVAEKITLNLVEVESITPRGEDTIFEIENKGITNRPDCFSHLGIAREVAAYFDLPFEDSLKSLEEKKLSPKKKLPFKVKVTSPDLCPRYCAIVLTDLKVTPSPKWLRVGIENCGIRSINNVVDITNYVMLELGQPLHAFDYEKIEGKEIIVRRARGNEEITTLDCIKRKLNRDVLVIADLKKPIGIAGIMGGENTEVTRTTKTIVLESANFNPINNRLSSKFLKLRTEASTRFEKGQDTNLPYSALMRTVDLLSELTGAKISSRVIDIQSKKIKPWQVKVKPSWINKFLGLKLSEKEIKSILDRLQLKTKIKNDLLLITIPTFRPDLQMEADIAEEVARIYGYDNIPVTLPRGEMRPGKINKEIVWRRKIKDLLANLGLTEVYTYPLIGKELIEKAELEVKKCLKLLNPLTVEREYFRTSLIPSMLETVKKNLKFFEEIKIFEIARIFLEKSKVVEEKPTLIGAITGKNKFYEAKGVVEALLEELGIKEYQTSSIKHQTSGIWHPTRTAQITKGEELLGVLGEIHPKILANFGIEKRVTVFNLDAVRLFELATTVKKYVPIPKYPTIVEDLCFIVKPKTHIGKLIRLTKQTDSIIRSVELIDSFNNQRTIRITYQHPRRTLKEKEVKKIREKIIKGVKKKLKAGLKTE